MRAWVERCVSAMLLYLPERQAADPLFYACAFMVACSLMLGGATRSGFPGDVILALLAIPLLALSVWRLFDTQLTRQTGWALLFCLALVSLPLLQLVPLPNWLWTLLPHRQLSVESYALVHQDIPWMPISVSPEATWLSALSLLPPISIFIATVLLGYQERRWLALVIIAVGVISVFLGLIQVAQGPSSPLRFYSFTNPTEAVGFFANRNHFSAFLYVLVLFASAWTLHAANEAASAWQRREFDTMATVGAVACFVLLVVVLAAQAMARSRAGMGLTIVALVGVFGLAASTARTKLAGLATTRLLFGAIAIALVLTVEFALYRILARFEPDPVEGARWVFMQNTLQAALAYLPFGAGVGTFVPVYHIFEHPKDVLANFYITRAHNDFIEASMEGGVFALALMVWFTVWLARRSLEVWRRGPPPHGDDIDGSLAKAATLVPVLLAAHSFVEYPMRTAAIMALAAFSCALLIDPPLTALRQRKVPARTRPRIKVVARPLAALTLASSSAPNPAALTPLLPAASKERWGEGVEWPEEWGASENPAAKKAPGDRDP